MQEVMIVWMRAEAPDICSIGYDDGRGPVRVYPKDRYDARLDRGNPPGAKLAFVPNKTDAVVHMLRHRKEPIQVPLAVGRALGFDD